MHRPHLLQLLSVMASFQPPFLQAPRTVGPMVDLSGLRGDPTARSLVVSKIGRACYEKCFFHVVNHGIPPSTTDGALRLAASFFDLPAEEKLELASDDITRPVRYGRITDEAGQFQRFFLKQYSNPIQDWIGLWPSKPVDYRRIMGTYAVAVRELSLQLMEAINESLGLDRAYLRKELEDSMQLMAINDYPVNKKSGVVSGFPPHTDYAFITVILQSTRGLEELDARTGEWNLARGVPGSLLVHVGDSLEVLSNGRYRSAVHRVAMRPGRRRRRVSIATLHGLAMHHKVEVARELVNEQHPKGYRESSFRGFLDFLSTKDGGDSRSYVDTLKINCMRL